MHIHKHQPFVTCHQLQRITITYNLIFSYHFVHLHTRTIRLYKYVKFYKQEFSNKKINISMKYIYGFARTPQ